MDPLLVNVGLPIRFGCVNEPPSVIVSVAEAAKVNEP